MAIEPDNADVRHALGLYLVRKHDYVEALDQLRRAHELMPANARYAYVYAIALNSVGQTQDALEVLKQANAQHPADFDILIALATISRDLGDRQAAIGYAEELVRAAPNAVQAKSLLRSLRNSSP